MNTAKTVARHNVLFFLFCLLCLSISVKAQKADTWAKLDEEGTQLYNEQKYEESLKVFLHAIEVAKVEFGINHKNYAGSVQSVGIIYYYLSQYDESEKYYKDGLKAFERATGKFTAEYEDGLRGMTYLYREIDNSEKLIATYEALLPVSATLHGKKSKEYFTLQKEIANLYLDRRDFARAQMVLMEGRTLSVTAGGDWYGDFCVLLFQLYAEQNQPAKAEPYFKEAKLIRNKSQVEFWKTIDFKKMTYSYEMDDQDARQTYWEDQAASLKEKEPKSVNYARTLFNLATLYETQENLGKAEPILMEAKAIILKNGTRADLGTLSGSLAYFYDEMGNQALAEKYYQDEIAIVRKDRGREHIDYGTACHNQSMFYTKHEDQLKWELYEKTALLIYAGQQAGYTYYASACMGLAGLYEKQGAYAKAEAYEMEAERIFRMAFGEEHYVYARVALGLAGIYEKQKKVKQAEDLILKAKDINEKVFGKDHIQYAGYCYELGQFYMRQQRFKEAAPVLREATMIKLKRVHNNFGNLSESEKKDLYKSGSFYIDNYAYCLVKYYPQDKSAAGDLYNLMMDTKGLIFQTTAKTRAKIMASGNDTLIESFHDWTAKRDYLAKVYAMSLEERKNKGIDLPALEVEVNSLEKNLIQQATALDVTGFEDTGDYDWKQIKSKLKPDEAAIEMVRASGGARENTVYGALIISGLPESQPELVVLPNGYELETRDIRYYHNSIQSRLDDTISYRKFWRPIAERLKGIKKVYLSPTGIYHQLSLPTLKNPATGKFLMDEQALIFVGNTRDLLMRERKLHQSATTFLLGYPDYKSDGDHEQKKSIKESPPTDGVLSAMAKTPQRFFDMESGTVTPLPGTLEEVETIQELLKSKNFPVSLLTGKVASEERLKKITNPGVLHIATHGFFMPDQHVSEKESLAGKKVQDPLLRSGLLLAGCETSLKGLTNSDEEDGILTAFEAMDLYLDDTDLVILSACETGVGEIDNGEGVYGLQRAFQQAGARFVLVSLWKVDDEATELLMSTFYKMQLDGVAYADAFGKARTVVREKYPDPYYWGAFVLIGK